MIMYLNGDKTVGVEISSYSRDLDVPNQDIRFNLNLSFSGDYDPAGFEYLADFANQNITDIEIQNDNGDVMLASTSIIAKLISLNESCDETMKSGYAMITIYEPGVTPTI